MCLVRNRFESQLPVPFETKPSETTLLRLEMDKKKKGNEVRHQRTK